MRASIKWLKDYVEFSQTPEELAEMMTMAGLEVDAIEYLGREIEKVVTGRLTDVSPHPNADRLLVCKVDTGGERLTICTGATNVKAGDVVPVALVGAKLPNGVEIGATNFRGVDSQGMLCSADELVTDSKILPPDAKEGILILSADTPVGVDPRPFLGLDDVVLEFGLTPNRADCFSVIGLAREVAALTGGTLKRPMLSLREEGEGKTAALTSVAIEDISLCPRFTARILKDIKIGPSPLWLQHRIQAAGMRPINNVVDVTNFVMLEMGMPMHAYDYNLLAKHSITVRRANPGERLTTLDGTKRELSPDMLVIADAVQAVGIAGVMGGLATEVTARTQTVLLEAASFDGASIRRTSRALGLRSEASGRFERGIDTANLIRALDRAAKLLEDMGACKVCPGVVDNYPGVQLPRQVRFVPEKINAYLGIDVPAAKMAEMLRRLDFDVEIQKDKVQVTVPTWRGDVTREADISEEIARLYGYDNIPATLPDGKVVRGEQRYATTIADYARDSLSANGFSEIVTYSFAHPAVYDKLGVPAGDELRRGIPIMNPITDEFPELRTTLMGGVLQTVAANLARKNDDLAIYELSSVYRPAGLPLTELPAEPLMLCGALCGKRFEPAWNQLRDAVDFYDIKGAVEELLAKLGIAGYEVRAGEYLAMHPGKTALFVKEGEILGAAGELHPGVQDAFGLSRKVYLFELDFERLVHHAALISRYRQLPKFPAISRDLAIILPETVPAAAVSEAIREAGGELLADVRLFDVYTGDPVPPGARSLAYSLTFRSAGRTLTDDEVEEHHRAIVAYLDNKLGAKLRL
ncbi:MAG TPA: phenylalanine--tRNA ligase subunit beta [Selenomonadales bacterium]|nr:phenylalanine--tRNA ligase subunit beta [Selenomonadales bacterium]